MNSVNEIKKFLGNYTGKGINHEKQEFQGTMVLDAIVGEKGILLSFIAKGEDGTIFHEEKSTVCHSLESETLTMWNLNSNMPGLVPHKLKEINERDWGLELVFGYNDRNDDKSFREEVKMELYSNGDVGYHYSWGMPGGDFAERSGVIMKSNN